MNRNPKYKIIKDLRTEKIYLDLFNSLVRNFEEVLKCSSDKSELLKEFPTSIDITFTSKIFSI